MAYSCERYRKTIYGMSRYNANFYACLKDSVLSTCITLPLYQFTSLSYKAALFQPRLVSWLSQIQCPPPYSGGQSRRSDLFDPINPGL
jgi:hypothetical protein